MQIFLPTQSAAGLTPPGSPMPLKHQVKKKADVAESLEGFNQVGLLVN